MEMTINMDQLLSLIPVFVSSVTDFCTRMSTKMEVTEEGQKRLTITHCFVKAAEKAFTGYSFKEFAGKKNEKAWKLSAKGQTIQR